MSRIKELYISTIILIIFTIFSFKIYNLLELININSDGLIFISSIVPILAVYLARKHFNSVKKLREITGCDDISMFNPIAKAHARNDYFNPEAELKRENRILLEKKIEIINSIDFMTWDECDQEKYYQIIKDLIYLAQNDYKLLKKFKLIENRMKLKPLIREHFWVLKRKIENAEEKNEYGQIVKDKTDEIWCDFLRNFDFNSDFSTDEGNYIYRYALMAYYTIDHSDEFLEFNPKDIPSDGVEFEHWVAQSLRKFDWDASVTTASGDQGVDIIAQKDGLRVGIQCKLYNGSVGNKAVQEIIAAKSFYNFHKSAVLSNASFTKSAKELALVSNVSLLSHFDIPNFDKIFL